MNTTVLVEWAGIFFSRKAAGTMLENRGPAYQAFKLGEGGWWSVPYVSINLLWTSRHSQWSL